jgi:Chaperone of endosialidase/Head domain of trimeric autotransporter adhesin
MKRSLTIALLLLGVYAQSQIGIGTTSPNSMLDVRGSLSLNYRAFTTAASAASTDNALVFTGTSVATLTLPDATTCAGRLYTIKNASSNASVLTIATTSSQTIDGLTSWSLSQTNKSLIIISNGANWYATSESLPGNSAGTAWLNGGNNVASQQNIGTTSNYNLPFITNNTEKMRLTTGGNLGIGTSTFNATYPERLLVDAGATGNTNYQNVIVGKGNTNSYAQLNIQNSSAGTTASSDVVATADNGNESINYIDMGVNSSGNTSTGVLGGANTAYLYSTGNDFAIGNGTTAKNLTFFTTTGGTYTERMRIDGSGNVGIGVTGPSHRLEVSSSSNPLYLGGVQTGAVSDSVLTIINGVVRKLQLSAINSTAWSITGNAGTSPSTNFLGTTDAQALIIKENNTQVGRFDANSIALGNGATTNTATNSYAFGSSATVAFGKANGYAIGTNSSVTADSSFSIGIAATTNGISSVAIGNGATANNTNSIAIGKHSVTAFSITDALAIGSSATANSTNAIAIGKNATTGFSLTNPVTIGDGTLVNGSNGVALGNTATVGFVANSTAIGALTSVTGANSTAIGYNTSVTQSNAIILGDRANTSLSVGIGSEGFSSTNREKLLVDAGLSGGTAYQNVIVGKGNTNSYAQLNIQNYNTGTSASSDVVATADNGNETVNYIDLGVNGSGNTSTGVLGGANTAYLYATGNDFAIGNSTTAKNLNFFTTSGVTPTERMRIDANGNVGIGTSAIPSGGIGMAKLAIEGANGSTSGPHLQFTTTADDYPLMQVLPWQHDNVSMTFDGYWDGSNWKSSTTTGGNFNFFKNNGKLSLRYANVNTQGSTITTFNDGIVLDVNGSVGVNTSAFNASFPEQLLVDAGATGNTNYQNVIVGKGNTNSYAQLNIQNSNAGTTASSDVVATANNGNETINYIDMGINSGSNTSTGVIGGANTAYLYTTGNDFAIGNGTSLKDLVFFTTTAGTYTERMRITSAGHLIPSANNTYNLGSSTNRWSTIYSNNILNTSDARLKKDIRDLHYGLSTVLNMHPVQYKWKDGADKDTKIGFLAQELRNVVPESVVGDETKENLAVNYIELIPVLVNAIKEQQKQIDELTKKIKTLERK